MFLVVITYQNLNFIFMNKNEFKNFFEPYSKNVDNANSLAFWRLSDDLIMSIIKNYIPVNNSSAFSILDAGGGTGRWICELGKLYDSKFILYDLSKDMLNVASENISKAGIVDRVKIIQGDLINMEAIETESIDYIVSIYSPISFIYEKDKAVNEMYRILKKGGRLLIMGHGYYNALASKINNYIANADELKLMESESMVKWGEGIPKLNIFSKETMEQMLSNGGFKIITTHGVPVFVQPGPEDWDSKNEKKSRISTALQDEAFYKQVYELEMEYSNKSSVSNRGMNIFTVVEK